MPGRFEVVIAGGGVAGLEAAFALHELTGERASVTLLSPDSDFLYRPLAVREPFTVMASKRYPLAEVLADVDTEFVPEAFRWLDAPRQIVHTSGGRELGYDALLLALGARSRPQFRHAITVASGTLGARLRELLAELEAGRLRHLAAVVPTRSGWPLPIYELILLLSTAARGRGTELEVDLVSAEEAPLAVFGTPASNAVAGLLAAEGIRTHMSVSGEVPAPGVVSLRPGTATIEADRVLALPQLYGPSTPGVPKRARGGFVAIDPFCRVRGVRHVFAAGDITDFPVKFGAVAGLQADTAARSIARAAGAPIDLAPFSPVIHGALLGGAHPLYLSAELIGHHCHSSTVSDTAPQSMTAGLAAGWLGPYLDARHPTATA